MALRMLVVDDMPAILFAIERYFQRRGCAVDCATTRQDAKRLAVANDYEVVITDLRLGADEDTDGLDLARFFRHASPATRIIVLSAYGSPLVEEQVRRIGVDRFLAKPQPLDELWRLVQQLAVQPPGARS